MSKQGQLAQFCYEKGEDILDTPGSISVYTTLIEGSEA